MDFYTWWMILGTMVGVLFYCAIFVVIRYREYRDTTEEIVLSEENNWGHDDYCPLIPTCICRVADVEGAIMEALIALPNAICSCGRRHHYTANELEQFKLFGRCHVCFFLGEKSVLPWEDDAGIDIPTPPVDEIPF